MEKIEAMADVMDFAPVDDNFDEPMDDATIALKDATSVKKGRGHGGRGNTELNDDQYDQLEGEEALAAKISAGGPQRSVEGWILFVSGVHEEATEEDVKNAFAEYGVLKNLNLNLDRRTGFVKGYALVEYETFHEAEAAKDDMNGAQLLDETIKVDWAFIKREKKGHLDGRLGRGNVGRRRGRSPDRD